MNVVTSFFVIRALQSLNLAQSAAPAVLSAADVSTADRWKVIMDSAPAHVVARQVEYEDCVVRTTSARSVRRLLLLVQDAASFGLLKDRVIPRIDAADRHKLVPMLFARAPDQPLYSDLFTAAKTLAAPATPTMVCNSDIFIPRDFNLERVVELFDEHAAKEERLALALTRYESERPGDAPLIHDYRGSHDAFVFRPKDLPIPFVEGVQHPQNCYKSENIVIHELQQAGFTVRNPCLSVRIVHHHAADVRQWLPPVDEERYARAFPEA